MSETKKNILVIGASMAMAEAIQSRMGDDAEIVCGDDGDMARKLANAMKTIEPDILPTWQARHGKEGRNKSDRKRNRKNRWG